MTKLEDLIERKGSIALGGGQARIEKQHEQGKMTARERLETLFDPNTFVEIDAFVVHRCYYFGQEKQHFPGDGVVGGYGKVDGRIVYAYAQDFTVVGGSMGEVQANKICKILENARKVGAPVVGMNDSGGARIQEGVDSLNGYGEIFYRNVKASGVIPQISVILGPCAGGAAYSPALTDFIFMVEGISHMFITGPGAVKAATGEEVDFDTLGGSRPHSEKSGVCQFVAKSEQDCFRQVRELLSFLPQNCEENPPLDTTSDLASRQVPVLERVCEMDPKKAFRIHHVIWRLADDFGFFEIHQNFAKNVVTGFIRLGGQVVGVVANNPACLGGALDSDASDKAARFIRFLNAFNIPLLTLVDTGGYLPGVQQEHGGIIRHGAKLLYAYSEASIPKVTLVLRKAYGGAYIAMGSKYLRGDFNFAFPSAEIAVMGPRGAVEILYSRDLKAEQDPAKKEELKQKMTQQYSDKFASPYQAATNGSIDEIIEPSDARSKIIRAFAVLRGKRDPRKNPHKGNIPL